MMSGEPQEIFARGAHVHEAPALAREALAHEALA